MNNDNVFMDDRINNVTDDIISLRDYLNEYCEKYGCSSYILKSALGTDETYEYENGILILIPKHDILIVDCGNNSSERFDEFYEEIIEDLGYLSDKYDYKKVMGRPRTWRSLLQQKSIREIIDDFDSMMYHSTVKQQDERRIELLISLLIGSINDPFKVGVDVPESDLQKVKKNIILYDSMQSRFIYETSQNKILTIQGLAGTGKTELLLHKLQKLYLKDEVSRIAFTCFNTVLANDMQTRVTNFFNYMHVDKQIEWNKRLWVFRSWGSAQDKNSGLYSYICNHYGIPFIRYSNNHDFGDVCKQAITQIKGLGAERPCFDYLLIDESQDFTQEFFELCELVTEKQVIKAGDIFQNIFDFSFDGSVHCDYLLNRCYRTDPRTLMFAHAIGMGLYEHPVLRWLQDDEWKACGYSYSKENGMLSLTRSPIQRFQNISSQVKSVVLEDCSEDNIASHIIEIVRNIFNTYPDATPDDIGIVFTNRNSKSYELITKVSFDLEQEFKKNVTVGHISKNRRQGTFFVSNINNVKGLEFPFAICVEVSRITENIFQRNAIYMALTRSFLTSYFIISSENNKEFIDIYQEAVTQIVTSNMITVSIPSQEEIEMQTEKIRIETQRIKKSLEEIVNEVCIEEGVREQFDYVTMTRLYKLVELAIESDVAPSEQIIRDNTKDSIKMLLRSHG